MREIVRKQRRLAGTVGAEYGDEFAAIDRRCSTPRSTSSAP